MSKLAPAVAHAGVRGRLTDSQWRARRIERQRASLWPLLEQLIVEIPEVVSYDFKDLRHLPGYRQLEPEGLVHVGILAKGRRLTIIAATRRVLLTPKLRGRLFALRRLARTELKKTIVVGPRSIHRMAARLRARREADPIAVPAPTCGR